MIRILAHDILFDGLHHRLSVAQFPDDFSSVEIFSFEEETASTYFIEGTITIRKSEERYMIEKNGRKIDLP